MTAARVPLLLDLRGAPVLCVGAGPVAAAKVVPLAEAGAALTAISPEVDPSFPAADVLRRPFAPGDVDRSPRPRLVVAGTGVAAVDDAVAAEAAALGIWCLRIDGRGDVAVPSVVRDGGVLIAISTGAPALTRRLRQHLEQVLDDRWGRAAEVLAALRRDASVRAALGTVDPAARRGRWRRAVDAALADPGDVAAARAALTREDDPA